MKEEEQDKKQRKRLVHASLFSGFGEIGRAHV